MDWIIQMLNLMRRRAYSLPLPKITGDVQIPAGWKVVWKWENVMLCHSWEPVWAKNGHDFDHLLQNSSGNMSCILATSLMSCISFVWHMFFIAMKCVYIVFSLSKTLERILKRLVNFWKILFTTLWTAKSRYFLAF